MPPDKGTDMTFAARSTDCPGVSAYGPVTAPADSNTSPDMADGIVMVLPPMATAPAVRAAASLNAALKSSWAWAAAGSPRCIVPFTVGTPVSVVPGLTPRSPLIAVAPVLVNVEPARTAKVEADPRATGACPAGALAVVKLQLMSVVSALPARSWAPVVMVAV